MAGLVPAIHEHRGSGTFLKPSCAWVTGIPRFALQPVMTEKNRVIP
jgi:hypothetical protein